MRDLDDLVSALRAEASDLPPTPLLPAVREGARRLHRRRLATSAVALVLGVAAVLGVGLAARSQSRTLAPSGASLMRPAMLTGSVWYLTSWTTARVTTEPSTDSAPTLAFPDSGRAVTAVPGWTTWTVRVGVGTLHAQEAGTTAGSMSAATTAVSEALERVLTGSTTWRVSGADLVIRQGSNSLSFTSAPADRRPGSVDVRIVSDHGSGLVSTGDGPVAGDVRLTRKDGHGFSTATVGRAGLLLQVGPGGYVVTATINDGSCAPTSVVVQSSRTASVLVSCRDGLSSD